MMEIKSLLGYILTVFVCVCICFTGGSYNQWES